MALYAEDLKGCSCSIPGCDKHASWLHAKCHLSSGLRINYDKKMEIAVHCYVCNKFVCSFAISPLASFVEFQGEFNIKFEKGSLKIYNHKTKSEIITVQLLSKSA